MIGRATAIYMRLVVNAPINKVSFGNVSYNILKELYKRKEEVEVIFVPLGQIDMSSFDTVDKGFIDWLNDCAKDNFSRIRKDDVALKLWHINGSESLCCRKQVLYSFYELDSPTKLEKSIIEYQDATIFSCSHSADQFSESSNVFSAGLGFDNDFKFLDKKYFDDESVHFTLMGKAEKRKNTSAIIKAWLAEFGNDTRYRLTCLITNPHLNQEWHKEFILDALGGKSYNNIAFNSWVEGNSQMNDILCSSDVDLTALSGAEGWNLPAFNAACLGAHIVGNDFTSHKDWVGNIQKGRFHQVEESAFEKVDSEDGVFFINGSNTNQGNINALVDLPAASKKMREASEAVLKEKASDHEYNYIKKRAGLKLQLNHAYEHTVDRILEVVKEL